MTALSGIWYWVQGGAAPAAGGAPIGGARRGGGGGAGPAAQPCMNLISARSTSGALGAAMGEAIKDIKEWV